MNEEIQLEDRSTVGVIGRESSKDDWGKPADVRTRDRVEGLVFASRLLQV